MLNGHICVLCYTPVSVLGRMCFLVGFSGGYFALRLGGDMST